MKKHRVFVYGTLKRGLENAHYMNGQTFIGEAQTRPLYRMYDFGGYPGIVASPDGLSIKGEIWEVDDDCKVKLDVLEDIATGLYTYEPVHLEEPYAADEVCAYYYALPVVGSKEVGRDWVGPLG